MASTPFPPQDPYSLGEEAYRGGEPFIDLGYVVAIIRRNLWLIGLIIGICLAVALAVTLLARPLYTATATVQVSEASQRVLDSQDPNTEANTWDYDRFINTEVDVLTSYALAEMVENALNMSQNDRFFRAFGIRRAEVAGDGPQRQKDAVNLLRRNLDVSVPRDTRIIPLAFTSGDAGISAQVANSFAEQFIRADLKRKFDSTAYARDFVSGQLAEAKQRLETSERELNAYARSAGLIRLTDPISDENGKTGAGGSITTASLIQLNEAANAARANRIVAEARWKAASAGPLLSSQAVLADPTVSALVRRKAEVEAQLAEESSRRLDSHPDIVSRRTELSQIQADLNVSANNVRRSIRSEYDAAKAAEGALSAQVRDLKGASLSEQDSSVQYALLAREADTNRQLYDEFLQRYKQLNAQAGVSASNISVIDRAQVPAVPSSPSLFFNLGVGLLLGCAIAGGVVFLRAEMDDSIRVPEDIGDKLELPLLGVIPLETVEDFDLALGNPKSPVSEAYYSLAGSLLYATAKGLAPTILITSSQPSEGKSSTSRALASTFARMGRRVVLVDADVRCPTLHIKAGIDGEIGLTTVLTGQAALSDAVIDCAAPGFAHLPAGPIPPSPTELLGSAAMQDVIDRLAEQYDLVLIDSSPILGLADAPLLSVLVDGVLFVVEAGKARRGALKTSLRRLKAMRPNILGGVLTKFDPVDVSNSYSSYYGYDYYTYNKAGGAGAG